LDSGLLGANVGRRTYAGSLGCLTLYLDSTP
jgi:hypothetical protein